MSTPTVRTASGSYAWLISTATSRAASRARWTRRSSPSSGSTSPAWHKIDEVPFDFERRRVSVLVDDGVERLLVVKGAPEDVLRAVRATTRPATASALPLDATHAQKLAQRFERLGGEGFRVLGVASPVHWAATTTAPSSATRPSWTSPASRSSSTRRKPSAAAADPGAGRDRCRGQDPDRRQRAGDAPSSAPSSACRSPAC